MAGHVLCQCGFSLAWPDSDWARARKADWKIGAAPRSGAAGCRKEPVAGLVARRLKHRGGLAWAMTQGCKKYKIRRPPLFPGVNFCKRQDSPCTEPNPPNSLATATEAVCPSVQVDAGGDSTSILPFFKRNSPQTRAFPFSTGKENFRQPCPFCFVIFWRAVPSASHHTFSNACPRPPPGSLALFRELTFSESQIIALPGRE